MCFNILYNIITYYKNSQIYFYLIQIKFKIFDSLNTNLVTNNFNIIVITIRNYKENAVQIKIDMNNNLFNTYCDILEIFSIFITSKIC